MITDETLERLREDATLARNTPLATRCGQALRGDTAARQSIEEALTGTPRPATLFITTTTGQFGTLAAYMARAAISTQPSTCDDEVTVAFRATPDQVADLTALGFTVEGGA
jgi:hypothetical protein